MADIDDNQMDNVTTFGIEDTMGNISSTEMIEGFLNGDSAGVTSKAEELTPIVKETEDPKPPTPPVKKAGKEIAPAEEEIEGKKPTTGESLVSDLLNKNDDDDDSEEEEEETGKPASKTPTTQFSALTSDLLELGVFTKDEDEEDIVINTGEEFLERFNNEKRKGAMDMIDNFLSQFGEDYRNAFEAIYVKGVDPKEYFGTYNAIVNYAELDLSKEDNQVLVIKQALADQGYEADDIESEVVRLRDYGDLETVANKHHKVMIKREANKLQELEDKAKYEQSQKQAIRNQYISNVNTILQDKVKEKEFDGIPLNPKLAAELQDFLLVDKWKTPQGETLSDFDRTILDLKRPENHAMKVKLALILKIMEKDPTLSTIQKTGATKRADTLFSQTVRQETQSSSTTPSAKKSPKTESGRWFL